MAFAKQIIVKKSEQELKALRKKQPVYLRTCVEMLLVIKKSKVLLSKDILAGILKINHNTAHKRRTKYVNGGIESLLIDARGGFEFQ